MSHSIKSFTDLVAWQKSHKFVVEIYKATLNFPSEEKFGLTSQLRRAGVSITSNIAEGFGRRSVKEKSQFYAMAYGSLLEVQNQLLIARDVNILDSEQFKLLSELSVEATKLISGLRAANKKKESSS